MKMRMLWMFLVAVSLIVLSCASSQKVKKPAYVPKFDYTPPSNGEKALETVTFGIVSAGFSEDEYWTRVWPFTDFSKNMSNDFQELLTARGFTVKGPFQSLDMMTYPDKNTCDLILTPSLEVAVIPNAEYKEVIQLLGGVLYKLKGNAVINGRVTLSMVESLSGERMWVKSIEVPSTTGISWEGEKKYKSPPHNVDFNDPGLQQALMPHMENAYNAILETAWKYLHPEEMVLLKKQAQELKGKKVY